MFTLLSLFVVAFIVTSLDDLVFLTAFCGYERYRFREVLVGQYVGFGVLLAVSLVGGTMVGRLFSDYARWLGLFPIVVGVAWFLRSRTHSIGTGTDHQASSNSTSWSRAGLVSGVAITDGSNNLAVYIPLFAVLEPGQTVFGVGILLSAVGIWVLIARWLADRPVLATRFEEYGSRLVSFVLVVIGVLVLTGLL